MRRLVVIFVLALGSASAIAQPSPDEEPMPPPPPSTMRQPEILRHKPSGFWTSNVPAKGGAYRYRLLGIGVGVAGITGFFMVRFLRKVSRERVARERAGTPATTS